MRRLYKSLVVLAALMLPVAGQVQAAPAAACTGSEVQQSFSFPAGSWTAGTTGPYSFTVGAGANAITLTFTSTNTGGIAFAPGFPAQTNSGSFIDTVRHDHSGTPANAYQSSFNLTTDRPVNKLKYVMTDIDLSTGNWQDQTVSTANNGATVFPTAIAGGARHTVNVATGTVTATTSTNCASADASCNATINFNLNGITSTSTEFRAGPAVATSTTQVAGWNAFEWCLPPAANLSITKSDGVSIVNAGSVVSYSIVVSNTGPSAANNAVFTDPAVSNLTVTGVTCGSAAGGASCPAVASTTVALMQGSGIVIPTLPSGGSVTFTVTGTAGTSGSIVNTATIAAPSGTTDPTPGNNSATDTNTIRPLPNLMFLKTLQTYSDPVKGVSVNAHNIPGAEVDYTFRVINTGLGSVDSNTLVIVDPIPSNTELFTGGLSGSAPFAFVDSASPSSGLSCTFVSLSSMTDCIDFSLDGSNWSYVPNGSYDPAVTHIRFRPSNSMNGDAVAGAPSPYFDLTFRVRIK